MSKQGSHFWHLVIASKDGRMSSRQGVLTPHRGETRWDVHLRILELVYEANPELREGILMTFDIQPNKL